MALSRTAKKKKAQAPLTEQAKMILRTVRRQLAAEQTAQAERLRQETINRVRADIRPTQSWDNDEGYLRRTHVDPIDLAFQKVVIPRTTAVLTSEGIRATVNVKMNSARNSGWTDFQNINVTMARGIDEDPANASAVLRGILYHEAGHIKYTVPMAVLINRYNTAIQYGSTRTRLSRIDMHQYHRAWNLAEDQRMEMQVVDDSPNKAKYFLPMVLDVVLNQFQALADLRKHAAAGGTVTDEELSEAQALTAGAYPFVAWRRYLPQELRRSLRAKYVARHGLAATQELEQALTAYIRASNPIAMWDAIVAFHNAIAASKVTIDVDNHGGMDGYIDMPEDRKDEEEAPTPEYQDFDLDEEDEPGDDEDDQSEEDVTTDTESPDGDDDVTTDEGEGNLPEDESWVPPSDIDNSIDGEDEDEDDETTDESETDDDDDDAPAPTPPNNEDVERDDTTIPEDDDLTEDDIQRMLEEAEEERNEDAVVQSDSSEFNMAMAGGIEGSKLVPINSTAETNSEVLAMATVLAEQLEEAFHAVTVELSPQWREQQTRGVLNVGRYVTRQHGDREFYRDFDGMEGEQPGHNIAVSVLLDYSGSMSGTEGTLAATAYAMKVACQNLDIPCTVVLWDHDARLLFDGKIDVDHVPVFSAQGSTDPSIALADTPNHRYERENHIVLVMTDGEFSTMDGYLNYFRAEGTYFIGAYYKHGNIAHPKELLEMSRKGFDIVHGIQHLSGLVDLMEAALCESVKP